MKKLYLLRHAKSSWDNPSLNDSARPLNERGKRNAPNMAKRLKEKRLVLDLIMSSPAVRAIDTASIMASVLGYPENSIAKLPALYHASPEKLFDIVSGIKNQYNTVMLVGHNPGLTEFADELVDIDMDNIPTCGIVALSFKVEAWQDISAANGSLLFYDYPKKKPHEK